MSGIGYKSRIPDTRNPIPAFILILATLLALGRVCTFEFTNYEVDGFIALNPTLNPPTPAGLLQHWRGPDFQLYMPITYTFWWSLAWLSRIGTESAAPAAGQTLLNPWIFQSANVALHVASALMVLAILRRLAGRETPALLGTLLFALHPIQVETVAWTSNTKDLLCGLFALIALHQYIEYAGAARRWHYAVATAAFVLSMLSKPAGVVTPLMAAIIGLFLLARPPRQVFRDLIPWLALAVPILIIARIVQPATATPATPLYLRPLIAADSLAFYLGKLLWPFNMTMAYHRTPQNILASGAIWWTWLIPAALALLIWRTRSRTLAAAGLLFIAGMFPVLGWTRFTYQQFSTVADRYVYLPMVGAALALGYLVSLRRSRPVLVTCGVILALLAVRTWDQAGTWSDRLTLYQHAVAVAPDSPVARNNLGTVLFNRGRAVEAEPHLRRAVEFQPSDPGARKNLALSLDAQGRFPELIEQLEALMRLSPSPQTQEWLDAARRENRLTTPSAPSPASRPS